MAEDVRKVIIEKLQHKMNENKTNYTNDTLAQNVGIAYAVNVITNALAPANFFCMPDLLPEGKRTKEQEWEAAYAAIFNQLQPALERNKAYKRVITLFLDAWVTLRPMVEYVDKHAKDDAVASHLVKKTQESLQVILAELQLVGYSRDDL